MSIIAQPIAVFLRRPYLEALQRRAEELGVRDAEAAARILEDLLQPWLEDPLDADRISAERELLEITAQIAREEAAPRPWNENLTLAVFERIRADHLDLYLRATSGGHERAVNQRLGRRIREATGAQVGKKPVTVKTRASLGALVKRYTLLKEP